MSLVNTKPVAAVTLALVLVWSCSAAGRAAWAEEAKGAVAKSQAPATQPAAAMPKPPVKQIGLPREEVMKETPGLVEAALVGPLKDVKELVYSVGDGYYTCYFGPLNKVAAGWGMDYDKYGWGHGVATCAEGWLESPQTGCALYRINVRTGERRVILKNPKGAIRGLSVSYDGQRIVFAYEVKMIGLQSTAPSSEAYPHLYEINIDGSGLHQLTDGPYDDMEPCFLPNGDLIFSSTRSQRWVGCCNSQTKSLFVCRPDGSDIRMHNAHLEVQLSPSIMADGRVAFSQWEYTGGLAQTVFLNFAYANPDGSGYGALAGPLFGNKEFMSRWQINIQYPRQVPGTSRIEGILHPVESNSFGWVVQYDMNCGPMDASAMRFISPHQGAWRWDAPPDAPGTIEEQVWGSHYPLSGNCSLVATRGAVHVMDNQGRHQTLFTETEGAGRIGYVQPLCARPREPVIPSQIDPRRDTGTLIVADANRSRTGETYHAAGLLVLEELPRPISNGNPTESQGRTYFIDRIIGTAPIETDGSAYFEVPADRELFFVLLDARGRAIKKMRSWTTLKPGETRSCIGCHEERTTSQQPLIVNTLLALHRPPSKPQRPAHVPEIIDFHRHIQPILDRHCVQCHDNTPVPGKPMLAGDRTWSSSLAYVQLYEAKQYEAALSIGGDAPGTRSSGASPLLDKLAGGHHEVHATPKEMDVVRFWIDAGALYSGTYASTNHFTMWNYWNSVAEKKKNNSRDLCDENVLSRRCASCHVDQQFSVRLGMARWPYGYGAGGSPSFINLTHPDKSLLVLAPLPRSAGGLGLCGGKPGDWKAERPGLHNGTPRKPGEAPKNGGVFTSRDDPDYVRLLASIQKAGDHLYKDVTRQDTPGFRPPPGWVWNIKRYGFLPPDLDPRKEPIDVYAVEQKYWESFYPKAEQAGGNHSFGSSTTDGNTNCSVPSSPKKEEKYK